MSSQQTSVAAWLLGCACLVFFMIVLGGLTRLTESGLSMVEWQPVAGIVPPMSAEAWQAEFALYQQSPEYRFVNKGMSLDAFKRIFWMEYAHRLLGRVIGLVFVLPFIFFLVRGHLSRRQTVGLSALFLLGALQGLLGWYMVQSGLVDQPHVSQYRLTAHLSLAFLLYGGLLWAALSVLSGKSTATKTAIQCQIAKRIHLSSFVLLGLVFLMIVSGGFMAGTRAGSVYNTFPLIDGVLFPETMWQLQPIWRNFFENVVTIQVQHRSVAILTLVVALSVWWFSRQAESPIGATATVVLIAILLQAFLGISALLAKVPVPLAASHQAVAVLVFTLTLYLNHRLRVRW